MRSTPIALLIAVVSVTAIAKGAPVDVPGQEKRNINFGNRDPNDCDFSGPVYSPEHMRYIVDHPIYIACQEKAEAAEAEKKKAAEAEKKEAETYKKPAVAKEAAVAEKIWDSGGEKCKKKFCAKKK